MGMFDYIRCEMPLPDGWQADELTTKDFDCAMEHHIISANGRLLMDRGSWKTVPEERRPFPGAGGLRGLIGSIEHTPRYEDANFHGIFRFGGSEVVGYEPDTRYGPQGKPIYRDHEYEVKFTDGQLVGIRLMSGEDKRERVQSRWSGFFAAPGLEIPDRAEPPLPPSEKTSTHESDGRNGPSFIEEQRCHYTGKPAFATVSAGIIHAGYGSRRDMTCYLFVKERPAELPEGACLSDDILDSWTAEGRIVVYRDETGTHPLAPDVLATAFDANRRWAASQLQAFANGSVDAASIFAMLFNLALWDAPDPVRLALFALIAEGISGRTVGLEELLARLQRAGSL